MNFSQLHERLRLELVRRVDRGLISAAALARQSGLQQPHISNFLHSKRRLSLAALDRVLAALALSVEDLAAPSAAPQPRTAPESVPLVTQQAAMRDLVFSATAWPERFHLPQGFLPDLNPRQFARAREGERFVAVGVTPAQARPMEPALRPNSTVVLDRHYTALVPFDPPRPNLYAVRLDNTLLFRYVEYLEGRLILRPHSIEFPLQPIDLTPQQSPSDLLLGRICFVLLPL